MSKTTDLKCATPAQIDALLKDIKFVKVKPPTRKEMLSRLKRELDRSVKDGWLTKYQHDKTMRLARSGYNVLYSFTPHDFDDGYSRKIVATREVVIFDKDYPEQRKRKK